MRNKNKFYGRLYSLSQIFLDFLTSYAILCAITYIYYLCGAAYEMSICVKLLPLPFLIIGINIMSRVYGRNLFYPGLGLNRIVSLKHSTLSVIAAYGIFLGYLALSHSVISYSRVVLVFSMMLSALLVPACRKLFKYLCSKCGFFSMPAVIAGAGANGRKWAKLLDRDCFFNVRIIGFLDDEQQGDDIIGKLADAERIAEEYDVNYLILCLSEDEQKKYFHTFMKGYSHMLLVPQSGLYTACGSNPISVARNWAFEVGNKLQMKIFRWEKNILELCLACLIVPIIFPVCVIIALLVKLTSPGPVFYRAKRLGQNGLDIEVLKFRTMYENADEVLSSMLAKDPSLAREWEERFKLEKDPRITPLGNFLRKTSLDELPQFLNVLSGDMAIIGPRPIVKDEIKYYDEDFAVFSMVKPGITGLWQISGRSDTDYETRVQMDVYYVSNWSFWLDYYIFLNTFIAVLFRRGAK